MNLNQSNQAYSAYNFQQSSAPPQPPVNTSVFNGFEGLLSNAHSVAARARMLADRLCGVVPESGNGEKDAEPNGIFEALGYAQRHLQASLDATLAAIERIESKLP